MPPRRRAPLTKAARHALVTRLVEPGSVRSQLDLVRLLADSGVVVTQATLSRDLDELGATKVRGAYAIPVEGAARPSPQGPGRLSRLVGELLVTAEGAGQFTVARTPPGGAHLLASALDRAALPDVMGTIAGDDTVLLVCRSAKAGSAVARRLLDLADSRTAEEKP